MKKKCILISAACVLALAACRRPECKNTNPVFENFAPGTEDYKKELVNQINATNPEKLRYWLESYKELDGKTYLQVNVQGDAICSKFMMQITNWVGLEDIKSKNGMGYHGAELKDLKFDIVQDSSGTDFIYTSVGKVVD